MKKRRKEQNSEEKRKGKSKIKKTLIGNGAVGMVNSKFCIESSKENRSIERNFCHFNLSLLLVDEQQKIRERKNLENLGFVPLGWQILERDKVRKKRK